MQFYVNFDSRCNKIIENLATNGCNINSSYSWISNCHYLLLNLECKYKNTFIISISNVIIKFLAWVSNCHMLQTSDINMKTVHSSHANKTALEFRHTSKGKLTHTCLTYLPPTKVKKIQRNNSSREPNVTGVLWYLTNCKFDPLWVGCTFTWQLVTDFLDGDYDTGDLFLIPERFIGYQINVLVLSLGLNWKGLYMFGIWWKLMSRWKLIFRYDWHDCLGKLMVSYKLVVVHFHMYIEQ